MILGFLAKRLPEWLADDDTEEGHLVNAHKEFGNHIKPMQEILMRNNNED